MIPSCHCGTTLRVSRFGAIIEILAALVGFHTTLIPYLGEGWVNLGAMYLGRKHYREALGFKGSARAYCNRAIACMGMCSAYLDYQQALVI